MKQYFSVSNRLLQIVFNRLQIFMKIHNQIYIIYHQLHHHRIFYQTLQLCDWLAARTDSDKTQKQVRKSN